MVTLERVCFRYNGATRDAVTDLSVTIDEGERLAVIGTTGAGKSTLGRLISGMVVPTAGRVVWHGSPSRSGGLSEPKGAGEPGATTEGSHSSPKGKVALVFQNPETQFVAEIVEDDVAFGPENEALPSQLIRRAVDDALQDVGAGELALREIDSLSGGEKQRVALAGALAMGRRCLILDEASAMLHPGARKDIETLIDAVQRNKQLTVIQMTHDLEEAAKADRVLLLHEGRLLKLGPPQDVLRDASTLQQAGMVAAEAVVIGRMLEARGFAFDAFPLTVDRLISELERVLTS